MSIGQPSMIQQIIHVLYPGLTPGKFCIGIEKRKQYFAKLWVVTKVYYGQYKSGHLTIQRSTLNLQTDPRLRVTKYSLS